MSAELKRLLELVERNQPVETEALARKVLAKHPDHPLALKALSVGLIHQQKYVDALAVLNYAIRLSPADWELYNNLAMTLHALMRWEEMTERLSEAVARFPKRYEFWKNLGTAEFARHRWNESVRALLKAIELSPHDDFDAIAQLGACLLNSNRNEEAITCLRELLSIDPKNAEALTQVIWANLRICDWRGLAADLALLRVLSNEFQAYVGSPFYFFAMPCVKPEEHFCITKNNARRYLPILSQVPVRHVDRPETTTRKIRIAYLSADFRVHPVGFLISHLLDKHDRERFEIVGYAIFSQDESSLAKRIRESCDRFEDISGLPVEACANKIRDDQIDILVDLTGWTTYGRTSILAYHPARVTVNWLGYPGTFGHERFADFIVGDSIVTPDTGSAFFTEKRIQLPGCYLPYDAEQSIGTPPSRESCGLPEAGIVFCSFNQSFKLNPGVFDLWCLILSDTPGSVLWLSIPAAESAIARLRDEMSTRGIDPKRLVLANKLADRASHLARIQVADIALDPFPYNSHSTGMDALWAGVPMVSLLGESFAGRVGASSLTAVGLDDLVASTVGEYRRIAVELARCPERLNDCRRRLADEQARANVFDMRLFATRLEAAYLRMLEEKTSETPSLCSTVSQSQGL